jgi:hypothetical protein
MSHDPWFEEWKRSRAADGEPAGFADRVMETIEGDAGLARPERRIDRVRRRIATLASSPVARAAALLVAGGLFLARLASLFAVFATP